jgi:hypothetical protein
MTVLRDCTNANLINKLRENSKILDPSLYASVSFNDMYVVHAIIMKMGLNCNASTPNLMKSI